MYLSLKTCTLPLPFEQMLDYAKKQGVTALEFGTGNWSGAPHLDLDLLLSSKEERDRWMDAILERNLSVCALNCSGNPLCYEEDMLVTEKTFRLAEFLGIKKIIMMSGLPAGCEGDRTPVWICTSWPPETQDILKYQWEDVAVPAWEKILKKAKNCGIETIALENHAMQLVYNPDTFFRLSDALHDPMLGMNLDPSHLFWMGGDPIEAARVLCEHKALYHLHAKDSRLEKRNIGPNGVLDTRPIESCYARSWNYVAVGAGHGLQWWKEFLSVCRMGGYDGPVSLEMEDMSLDAVDGHSTSLKVLRDALMTF